MHPDMGPEMAISNSETYLQGQPQRARAAAVAGSFYPAGAGALRAAVAALLAGAGRAGDAPKALIVPHAGYIYSGPVAAQAYAMLAGAADRIRRVVLLGPAHRVYLHGLALPSAQRFDTPLGPVPLDLDAIQRIAALPQVGVMDEAHAEEHSLEVQLPFLQQLLPDFSLVPLVVGDATPREVAEVLAQLWGGPETLIVISTDLSHYHDYATAQRLDAATSHAIEQLALEQIGPRQACGCMPLRGLLQLCRERGLAVRCLDLRNSGDTAGPRDRVVGYGAYAVAESASLAQHADALLAVARASIAGGLDGRAAARPDAGAFPAALRECRAAFVTLTIAGRLRGCIGTTEARLPLVNEVAESAWNAAFRDPRFAPLSRAEFAGAALGISVLSVPQSLPFTGEAQLLAQLQPGVHGLIIEQGERRATFLPAVWDSLPEPVAFLAQLKCKAGIGDGLPPARAWTYTAESLGG